MLECSGFDLSGQSPVIRVALDAAAFGYDQLYSYAVDPVWDMEVVPGMRVAVPFGKGNRRRIAMVLEKDAEPKESDLRYPLKPAAALLDKEPVLTDELLAMVNWLHEHTFCTWYDAVRAVLPGGMQLRLEERYVLLSPPLGVSLTQKEQNFLSLLQKANSAQERDAILRCSVDDEKQKILESLLKKGCLLTVSEGRQLINDCTAKMVRLSPAFREDETAFRPTAKQMQAVNVLREHASLSVKECAYYAGVTEAVVKNLVKSGAAEYFSSEMLRVPRDAKATVSPKDTRLSPQQQAAYDAVAKEICDAHAAAFLLYGVTGSGKTAVFEQLIALTLERGRQALLLIPEISLTPQIVQYFQSRFGNRVALIHSGLSLAQRFDTDKLIRRGEISIVIGTRSAVFAPLPNPGLIILDEEGEHSYKSEQSPRYHAAEVARMRAKYHGAALVLASATPSLESMYLAEKGVYRLLQMPERYNRAPLPAVSIIDMNEERMNGNGSPFSIALSNALNENLQRHEQSILLLNRRGYQTMLQCTSCYEPLFCPNCSVPLTFHKPNQSLMCHYCGHVQTPEAKCPKCGSEKMRKMGFGTQKLEEELQALLPDARILRMDADTTMTRSAYENGFRAFANQEYDILCGTQMIGKGLDFPNVTLVGVVSIDKALFAGDFRSYERTFSLVTQVVGRGGRGRNPGRAILQTFMPEHYVLHLAAEQDYNRFYNEELSLRRAMMYPPVCDICVIGFSGVWEEQVRASSERFIAILQAAVQQQQFRLPLRVLGPVDAGYGRLNGKFRRRILIKCKNTEKMRALIRSLLEKAYADKAFSGVSVYADMNGDCGV
ncbi:MAG: primosomal protein N' [Oscillospiraceae bacterium]|nr:primosomal protein N' [Oscillospiraceae bacterium]